MLQAALAVCKVDYVLSLEEIANFLKEVSKGSTFNVILPIKKTTA